MAARGVDFLENWIAKNVSASDHAGGHQRAVVLANQCAQEAAAQNIPREELESNGGLSVTGIILKAILHLAEEERRGNKKCDVT